MSTTIRPPGRTCWRLLAVLAPALPMLLATSPAVFDPLAALGVGPPEQHAGFIHAAPGGTAFAARVPGPGEQWLTGLAHSGLPVLIPALALLAPARFRHRTVPLAAVALGAAAGMAWLVFSSAGPGSVAVRACLAGLCYLAAVVALILVTRRTNGTSGAGPAAVSADHDRGADRRAGHARRGRRDGHLAGPVSWTPS